MNSSKEPFEFNTKRGPKSATNRMWVKRRTSHNNSKHDITSMETEILCRTQTPRNIQSRSRSKNHEMREHLNRIKHMQKHIADIGSVHERKKLNYDMVAHPVMFLREKGKGSPSIKAKFVEKILRPPQKIPVYEKLTQRNIRNERPKNCEGFEEMLLDIIVKRRIFKDKDIDKFFENIRKNSVLPAEFVEEAIGKIRRKLEE
ncbi:hypothetical protein SteCoe_10577 [Stentor coeruleus]|uniref:Uncharacterized protein n=1 Tax=Stentor coeruleus TaxID=5963 RepID=A0A1R2CF54_9CILI|nr:hypothetical protein SteCoe_10577 [Stentor coeruleus]